MTRTVVVGGRTLFTDRRTTTEPADGLHLAADAVERSHESYTPPEIVAAARAAMGGIDLDPASCPEANTVVQADRILTAEDDGCAHDWHGRVWLNPPYNGGQLRRFGLHLATQLDAGNVTACVGLWLLTRNLWCMQLMQRADMVLMVHPETRHWGPNPARMAPMLHCLWLFGAVDPEPLMTLPCVRVAMRCFLPQPSLFDAASTP